MACLVVGCDPRAKSSTALDVPDATFVATVSQALTAGDSGPDGQDDAAPDGGACDHGLYTRSCWSLFRPSSFGATQYPPTLVGNLNFFGGAFDGRYVYWVNAGGGAWINAGGGAPVTDPIFRYDTQVGLFGDDSSWSTFDVHTLSDSSDASNAYSAGVWGFEGAAFDGRYVYLVPNLGSSSIYYAGGYGESFDGVVARYDTQGLYASPTSWSTYDIATGEGDSGASRTPGFIGAAFDGRYVYFVPNGSGETEVGLTTSGVVVRYDTKASFDDSASWSRFDARTVNGNAAGFEGAVFDGRYVYFVPNGAGNATNDLTSYAPDAAPGPAPWLSGLVVRYDTGADFGDVASWSTFDATTVSPFAAGFAGAAFDGRYVYFAPGSGYEPTFHTVALRYDAQSAFTDPASWSVFDTFPLQANMLAPWSYTGVVFDGRYADFIPAAGAPFLRFDTRAAFSDASAWTSLDLATVDLLAASYAGGVFDGRYVYLVPTGDSPALRFDATEPVTLDAAGHASFF